MLQDWYKITFSASNFSASKWVAIQAEFTMLMLAAGNPPNAALFSTYPQTSASYDYYFSPAAAVLAHDLIARYAGTRCSSPIGVVDVGPPVVGAL